MTHQPADPARCLHQAPNALSIVRLVLAPILLALAWFGRASAFLVCFAVSLLTDLADGFLARRFRETSELGAKLDSWGDLAMYLTLPLSAWWLWAGLIVRAAQTTVSRAREERPGAPAVKGGTLVWRSVPFPCGRASVRWELRATTGDVDATVDLAGLTTAALVAARVPPICGALPRLASAL